MEIKSCCTILYCMCKNKFTWQLGSTVVNRLKLFWTVLHVPRILHHKQTIHKCYVEAMFSEIHGCQCVFSQNCPLKSSILKINKRPMAVTIPLQRYYLFLFNAGIQNHWRSISCTYRTRNFSKTIISIHAGCWAILTTNTAYQLRNRTCCSVLSCNISIKFHLFY